MAKCDMKMPEDFLLKITFTFRDGIEKTVPIKNGVRPYTKRNKPQEVDGNDG